MMTRARGQCGHQSCGTRSGDEHVAMGVTVIVMIRVRMLGGDTEPGRMPDNLFVGVPGMPGEHECLVVETCAEQAAEDTG
jgi:hypothetical protein